MNNTKINGSCFILAAGLLWGTIGLSVRNLNALGINTMQVIFLRAVFTLVILLPAILIFNRSLLKIEIRDIWCFFGTGIISILFFTYLNFYTLSIASLSFAAVMMYTAPIMLMLISAVLFKEKITLKKIIACIVAFIGTALTAGVFGNGCEIPVIAVLTGLGSGFFYALYTVFSRYAMNRSYNSLTVTFYTFAFVALGSLPFADIGNIVFAEQGGKVIAFSLVLALVNTVAPYLLYNIGLKYVENSTALIIASVEPVTATLMGFFIYGETLSFKSFIGMLFVLSAVVILNFSKRK